MNVTVAIDSFKGSLTSLEAGRAVKDGILEVFPSAVVNVRPIADGGEGTVDALTDGLGGIRQVAEVTGPLGEPVSACYGIVDGTTAVMEMSAAAGITLVPEERRNPLYTTTYGVGEMILDAIGKGCRNFIIGIGGSATNDGGAGMLRALGFGMKDMQGNDIPDGAVGLKDISIITKDNVPQEVFQCRFNIACDVVNPLCGAEGCSAVYGPQKGADEEMIESMDNWLSHYADVALEYNPRGDKNYPGSGAAGGIGFAFMTFLGGVLQNGIGLILEQTGLEGYISTSDIVVTGEGRLDSQTIMGKVPVGVSAIAKKYSLPVLAFAGSVTKDASLCNDYGIDAFFPVVRGITTLAEAMEPANAYDNLRCAVVQAFNVIKALS